MLFGKAFGFPAINDSGTECLDAPQTINWNQRRKFDFLPKTLDLNLELLGFTVEDSVPPSLQK
ncbi:hypothetical protein DSO57_1001596 [Entomophthora muscae]|uniref:Uncharacterized protein n=1 Tax=Entomophthora muscae TaxID=34485 RepID=A0ACC2SBM6_9FUNG|nr:hypothetical protein DSO57_1001596 [Entomophthora muscae]